MLRACVIREGTGSNPTSVPFSFTVRVRFILRLLSPPHRPLAHGDGQNSPRLEKNMFVWRRMMSTKQLVIVGFGSLRLNADGRGGDGSFSRNQGNNLIYSTTPLKRHHLVVELVYNIFSYQSNRLIFVLGNRRSLSCVPQTKILITNFLWGGGALTQKKVFNYCL